MKKQRTLLTTIVVLLFSAQICAQTVEINGIWYTLVEKAKTAEVIAPTDGTYYTGSIVIPSVVINDDVEYSVVTIGENAFESCSELTSIVIPNSVSSIENDAFSHSGLRSVMIPNSVQSISDHVFDGCSSLAKVFVPNSVTSIGVGAFSGCGSLKSITLPNSITKIATSAFQNCASLGTIKIPEHVTAIGIQAFSGCSSLSDVIFHDNILKIWHYAFEGCSSLTEIVLPAGLTNIHSGAFAECSSLKTVTIGPSVTFIEDLAFGGCAQLTDIYCNAENVPSTNVAAFDKSYPEYMTLHVPAASISSYESTAPWSSFGTIKSIDISIATLSVTSGNGGVVTIGQTTIKENTTSVYVKKNNQTEITITPDSDFAIDKVLLDGNDVTSQVVNGNLPITLTADATLTVSFKLTATECTVTMTDDIATFCCAYDLDFTNVSGLKAYLAGGYDKANGKVMLIRVNSVPAGTGLILMGEAGTYEVPYSTSTAFYTNLLKGVTASTTINPTDGSNTNFILANGTNGIGFYAVSSSGELAAGKAYLQLPTSAAQAKSVKMVFEDETTGIVENYEFENKNNDGTAYDLMGRKVKNMTKGMYIMNGKKVIKK